MVLGHVTCLLFFVGDASLSFDCAFSNLSDPSLRIKTSLSRASAADNLSYYAWIAQGYFSARASTVVSGGFAISSRAAEGNFRLIPNRVTTEAVVERANVKRDKEVVRL